MAFTGIIDDEVLFVLLNDQRVNKLWELARLQKEARVRRAMGTPARNDVEMRSSERLVDEDTAGHEQPCERLEQRPIEKTHADNRIDRLFSNGKLFRFGHDAEYSRMTSDGGKNRSVNEVHQDNRSSSLRQRRGVASRATSHVENQGMRWQREASVDDPGRRNPARVATMLEIPRLPVPAIVSRRGLVTHR